MSTVRHSIPSTSDAHLGEESDNIVKNNQVRTKTRQPSLRKAFMMFSLLIVLLLILESDALPLQSPPNRNSELMSNYMTQIQRHNSKQPLNNNNMDAQLWNADAELRHPNEPINLPFGDQLIASDGEPSFLPNKWDNIFMAHHARSFLPHSLAYYDGDRHFDHAEKKRRAMDDAQHHFVDNYVDLIEPGRLEWNFNRL